MQKKGEEESKGWICSLYFIYRRLFSNSDYLASNDGMIRE
jgi:hypothetical protein